MDSLESNAEIVEDNGTINDPYAPENIGVVQYIQLARNYDVLMAILHHFDPTAASRLLETHSNGALLNTAPFFNGVYLTDEANNLEDNQ